jgi:hypothetical protein
MWQVHIGDYVHWCGYQEGEMAQLGVCVPNLSQEQRSCDDSATNI